jgi:hypothetical protein
VVVATVVETEATAETEVVIVHTEATEAVTVRTAVIEEETDTAVAAIEVETDTAVTEEVTEEDTLPDGTMNLVTEALRDENGTLGRVDLMPEAMITARLEVEAIGTMDEMTGGTEGRSREGMIGSVERGGIERVFPAGRYIFFATPFSYPRHYSDLDK